MNVLLLSPFVPDPAAVGGAPRAIFDRLHLLSSHHQLTVLAMRGPDEPSTMPALEALGVRLISIPRTIGGRGSSILGTFRKRVRLAVGVATDRRPMLVQEFGGDGVCAELRRLIRTHAVDIVFVEHVLMAQHLPCLKTTAARLVVFTDHDVGATGARGGGWVASGSLARPVQMVDWLKWRRYVADAYREASIVLVPTAEDAREVRQRVPAAKVRVVPFGVIEAEGTGLSDQYERDSTRLLFIGNFDHAPNRDAAAWLCDEIMPTVWRAKPDVHLWLVGHAPTPAIMALRSERVTVLGDVPSVVPYLRSAGLFVAPIREGAGMRMKLLEAMGAGIAVVTTSLGARGLDATAGQDLILADDAASFADSIVSALDAPVWRAQLGAAGRRLVSSGARRAERAAALEAALA